MDKETKLDVMKLLQLILRDGVFEIHDFDEPDVATGRTIARALDLHLIRDDSAGWDNGARYVLTNDGRRALGLKIDWWIPEDLCKRKLPMQEAGGYIKDTSTHAKPAASRLRHNDALRNVSLFTPMICLLIAVLCCVLLFKFLDPRAGQPPLGALSSRSEGY